MLTAYSYLRFSDPKQATGDSVRRQTEIREPWLAAHPDVTLDTSLRMTDKGIGAFRGRHRSDKHCLGQFIRHVEKGTVKPGSFLLVENLDRLSREETHDATELFLKLTRLGVVIVQLSPVVVEYRYPVEMSKLLVAVVEMSRGHSESLMKSKRVSAAWKSARDRARTTGEVVNLRTLPGWIEIRDGKQRLIPERAAVIRRVHQMAQHGYGVNLITKKLNADGLKPWGRAALWSEAVVYRLMTARTVIGEWQPGTGGRGVERKKVGDPIPGYFPAVITEAVFNATQASIAKRHGFRGRRGKHVNLFGGLLLDAFSRGKLGYSHEARGSYVFNYAGRIGEAPLMTYPAKVLESQILSVLREVDPAVITGDDEAGAAVLAGEGRLREIDTTLADIEARIIGGSKLATLERAAEKLETERAAVAARLEKDKQRAAVPSARSWSVVKETANIEDEETRMRLRSALRECVSAIWCVFAGHKTGRYRAWLNIMLPGGGWREVLFWADTGHKRSKRKPGAGIVAGGGRGDELAKLTPADEPYEPAPVLALENGADWAKQWRDEQLEVVAGRKKLTEVEVCESEG